MSKHKKNKKSSLYYSIKYYVNNNIRQYLVVATIFIIGIAAGVIIINYLQDESKNQINETIKTFINCLKDSSYQIDYSNLLKRVMINHMLFTFILWFLGCSVIGIPIAYILIASKGFSLGYTVSSVIFSLGIEKGTLFILLTLFLQNIFVIPSILSIAVSGTNLYKSIIKNRRMENIKIEIIRHTLFCFIMLLVLLISSFIEVYMSGFLIKTCVRFF